MNFNSVEYLIFLPIVVTVYFLLPKKVRYIWLLAASYYFYMQWNAVYILLILTSTVITYTGGLIIEKLKNKITETASEDEKLKAHKQQKLVLILALCINLGILGFYKYFKFFIECINEVTGLFGIAPLNYGFDIILPVGISFFTLQSLGYLIDVYRGDIYAEKNFLRYALFVSFFPQLVAGPIERSKNLLKQLYDDHDFKLENLKQGLVMIAYGLFIKIVVADRAATIVDTVFADFNTYSGWYILYAITFFSIQIYGDFYGYSVIARGSALILDIRLIDNFQAPFYSSSVPEFWRRWHISLTSWFRDYLYFPLGGSRKGQVKKERNQLIVFGVSGLWHGAAMGYVVWGLLSGIYQVIDDLIRAFKKKHGIAIRKDEDKKKIEIWLGRIGVFILITFAGIFFRAATLRNAYHVIQSLVHLGNFHIFFDGSLLNLGVPLNYMIVLLISVVFMMVVDHYKYEGKDVAKLYLGLKWPVKFVLMFVMVFIILLYGVYGEIYDTSSFIYFQF